MWKIPGGGMLENLFFIKMAQIIDEKERMTPIPSFSSNA